MARSYVIRVYPKSVEVAATALHDGTNGFAHRDIVHSFTIQPIGNGTVFLGDGSVTDDSDGFKVSRGQTANWSNAAIRGTAHHYDLKQIYYVGGPFKLILEEEA